MCTAPQSHLILLANPGEGGDLLRHLDDPLDRQVGQVDHARQKLVLLDGKDIHLIRLGSLMYLRKSTSAFYKRQKTDIKVSERWRKIATLLGQPVRQVSVMRCRVH